MLKQETHTLWKLSAVMIGVSVPLLLLGPAPMIVLLILGLVCGLIATHGTSLRSTVAFIAQSRVVPLIIAVYGALFLSALMSVDMAVSMSKFGDLVGMGLLAVAFYVTLREMPPRHIAQTYLSYSASIIVVAGVCFIDIVWNEPRLSNLLHGEDAANFSRLHHMSSVFAVMLPFLFAWLMRQQREAVVLAKWFAIPVSIAVWIILFLCGGMAGWIAALITGAIFMFMAIRYHDVQVTASRIIIGLLAFLSGPVAYIFHEGWSNTLDYIGLGSSGKSFFAEQLPVWSSAFKLIQENPVMGFGLRTFSQLPEVAGAAHPNNMILQLLVETGMIGTIAVLVLLGVVLRYFYVAARTNLYGLAGFCSILAFTIAALMFTSIFSSWWLTLLLFNGLFAARVGYAYSADK